MTIQIWCDSGLKEGCIVIKANFYTRQENLVFQHDPRKVTTHNIGEYVSVIAALTSLSSLGLEGAELFTDSQLVVGQVTQGWKVKAPHLLPYVNEVKRRLEETNSTLTWIPREGNLAGWVLENREK